MEGDQNNINLDRITRILKGKYGVKLCYKPPSRYSTEDLFSDFIQNFVVFASQISFETCMTLLQHRDWEGKFWSAASVADLLSPCRDKWNRSEVANIFSRGPHNFKFNRLGYESSIFRLQRSILLADEALALSTDSLKGFEFDRSTVVDGTLLAKRFDGEHKDRKSIVALAASKEKMRTRQESAVESLAEASRGESVYFDPVFPPQLIKVLIGHGCLSRRCHIVPGFTTVKEAIGQSIRLYQNCASSCHPWHHGFLCQCLQLLGISALYGIGCGSGEGYGGGPPRQTLLPEAQQYLNTAAGALSASQIVWSLRYRLQTPSSNLALDIQASKSTYRTGAITTISSLIFKKLITQHQWIAEEHEESNCEQSDYPPPGDASPSNASVCGVEAAENSLPHMLEETFNSGRLQVTVVNDILEKAPVSLTYTLFLLCSLNEDYGSMLLVSENLLSRYTPEDTPLEFWVASVASLLLVAESHCNENTKRSSHSSLVSGIEDAATRLNCGLRYYPQNYLLLWLQSLLLETCVRHGLSLNYILRVCRGISQETSGGKKELEGSFTRDYTSLALASLKKAAESSHTASILSTYGSTAGTSKNSHRLLNTGELSPSDLAKFTHEDISSIYPPYEINVAVCLWCSFARSSAVSGSASSAVVAVSNAEYLVELWHMFIPGAMCNILVGHLLSSLGAIYESASDLLNAQKYYSHVESLDLNGCLMPMVRNIGIELHRLAKCQECEGDHKTIEKTRLLMEQESLKVRLQALLRKFPWCWQLWVLHGAVLLQNGDHSSGASMLIKSVDRMQSDVFIGQGSIISFPSNTNCTFPGRQQSDTTAARKDNDKVTNGVPPWNVSGAGWNHVKGSHIAGMIPLTLHF